MSSLLLAARLLLVAGTGPGREASSTAVVAVAEAPGPDRELAQLAAQFRDALAVREAGVLSAAETRARMTLDQSARGLGEFDRDIAAARARFQAGDYAEGVRQTRAAADALETACDLSGVFPRWARAILDLARAEQSLGHREESRKLMERLLRVDPKAVADPDLYPPSFTERFESARTALAGVPRRRLVISTRSPQARIYLEGRDLGLHRASVSVVPGPYIVRVTLGATCLPPVHVEVGNADLAVSVDTDLAGALRPQAGPGLAASPADLADRVLTLASLLRVDRIYTVSTVGSGRERVLSAVHHDIRTRSSPAEGTLRLAGNTPPPGGIAALVGLMTAREASPLVEAGLLAARFRGAAAAAGDASRSGQASELQVPAAGVPRQAQGNRPCPEGMALLPAGRYLMGERKDEVSVEPFCLDVTEVTVRAYQACVKTGTCSRPDTGGWCNGDQTDRADHPVNCVSFRQAETYCRWAGKRLPTEEEWEWAARGAERGTTYPWGSEAPASQLCWDGKGSDVRRGKGTCPVGSYPGGDSPHGVKDLAGNAWEFTDGWYDAKHRARVVRGGSWGSNRPKEVSAALRDWDSPQNGYQGLGFRCAIPAPS